MEAFSHPQIRCEKLATYIGQSLVSELPPNFCDHDMHWRVVATELRRQGRYVRIQAELFFDGQWYFPVEKEWTFQSTVTMAMVASHVFQMVGQILDHWYLERPDAVPLKRAAQLADMRIEQMIDTVHARKPHADVDAGESKWESPAFPKPHDPNAIPPAPQRVDAPPTPPEEPPHVAI